MAKLFFFNWGIAGDEPERPVGLFKEIFYIIRINEGCYFNIIYLLLYY